MTKKKIKNTPSSPLYKELDVLKLCDLYYYNLATTAHEFYYGQCLPSKINDKYVKKENITQVKTRHNELELYYQIPSLMTTYKKPTLISAALWNTLPTEIRCIETKNAFKRKLKRYFTDKY